MTRRLAALRTRLTSGRWSGRAEALVLAGILLLLFAYHYGQALERVTPYIFIDELLRTEAARAVAETGWPEVRGTLRPLDAVHAYLLAPAWLLPEVGQSWAAVKAIGVAAAVLSAVPIYLLVRPHVSAVTALTTSAAVAATPAIFWGSTAMAEPIGLLVVSLAALATVRYLETPRIGWLVALVATLALAAGLRGQLAILAPAAIGAIATGIVLARRRPRPLELGSALALAALALAALVRRSGNQALQERLAVLWERPDEVIGALGRGVGTLAAVTWVLPAVALLAICAWVVSRDARRRAIGVTFAWIAAVFLAYTALKAVSLSVDQRVEVLEERNLVYLQPLAVAALALSVAATRAMVAATAAAVVAVAMLTTPYGRAIGREIPESPGMLWVRGMLGERSDLDPAVVPLLLGLAVVAGLVLWWPRARAAVVLVILTVAFIWGGTFIYRDDHRRARANADLWLSDRSGWVDDAAADREVALVLSGDQVDPLPLWLAEFWNSSIEDVVDLDGTGRYVAPVSAGGTANGGAINGADEPLALVSDALAVPGRRLATGPTPGVVLVQPEPPARVAARLRGRYPDGWIGEGATIERLENGPSGTLVVPVDRRSAFTDAPRTVRITGGVAPRRVVVRAGRRVLVRVPVAAGPFIVEVTVDETARPSDVTDSADSRELGVIIRGVRIPGISGRL